MCVTLRVTGYMNRGHPVICNLSNFPEALSRLACLRHRAQGSAGPLASFRPTHRGGRSTHGPTTVRAALRPNKRPCRLSRASCPRDRRSIARGARGHDHDKWFRSTAAPRGSVRKRAPESGGAIDRAEPPRRTNGAPGGARDVGGLRTTDGIATATQNLPRGNIVPKEVKWPFYGILETLLSASRGQ